MKSLNMIFKQFYHFLLKIIFFSLSQFFFTKKVIFCHFLKIWYQKKKMDSLTHFHLRNVYFYIH